MNSYHNRVREKILKPTLSIYQLADSKSIAEKSFITGLALNNTFSPTANKCLENVQNLSFEQKQTLHDCLLIKPAKVV